MAELDKHVAIELQASMGLIDLRIPNADHSAREIAARALGFGLPLTPRHSTDREECHALWQSRDQWLILGPREDVRLRAGRLDEDLAGRFASVTDLSDALSIIRLHGPAARLVLMKGTSSPHLADNPSSGTAFRARLADIAATIHVRDKAAGIYDLIMARSYGAYMEDWLHSAAHPAGLFTLYGVQTPPPV